MKQAEKIADEGRRSISSFCIEECKSYCCRKGYLVLNKKQVDAVVGEKKEMYKEQLKPLKNGKTSLFLGKSDKPCPSLREDFKCGIYTNPQRPKACSDFPLFFDHTQKLALFSPRCLAVQQNKLFPYAKRLQALGYEIAIVNEIVDLVGIDLLDNAIHEKTVEKK